MMDKRVSIRNRHFDWAFTEPRAHHPITYQSDHSHTHTHKYQVWRHSPQRTTSLGVWYQVGIRGYKRGVA